MPEFDVEALKKKAVEYRKTILKMINRAGCGHPGGSLSSVEIFITLYGYQMKHNPKDPKWEGRDRFIMSKGHCTPVTYTTLADFGYFPKEELDTFRQYQSRLQGHVYVGTPGVEFNTGSLGHGLSVANGIGMAAKMQKKDFKAYCLLGDGEIQEGSVWEAAMSASHHKLDNVCAIVDYNQVQQNDLVNKIKNLEPLKERWASFGWEVVQVDGHNFNELKKAFDQFGKVKGKPFVVIAKTVKGKGVSFMELNPGFHGVAPNDEELQKALAELK